MMEGQKFTSFCVFCYKTVRIAVKEADNLENVDKFTEFVGKYTGRNGVHNVSMEEELDELKILFKREFKSCTKCKIITDEFCNLYHELKVLELKMDWKLGQLVKIIKHANRVPLRWTTLCTALTRTFNGDMEMKMMSQNLIRKYRQSITRAGHQRNLQSQPCVVLEKGNKTDVNLPANKNKPSSKVGSLGEAISVIIDDHHSLSVESSVSQFSTNNEWTDQTKNVANILGDPLIQTEQENPTIKIEETDLTCDIFNDSDRESEASFFTKSSCSENTRYDDLRKKLKLEAPKNKTTKNNKNHECEVCKRTFGTNRDKIKHFKTCHNLDGITDKSNLYNCQADGCSAYFITQAQLSKHQVVHDDQGLECPKCKKSFASSKSLRKHRRRNNCLEFSSVVVSNEVMQCSECDLMCKNTKELWLHRNEIHEHKVCKECGMEFLKTRDYLAHVEMKHKLPTEWIWECNICGKKFPIDRYLDSHKKMHRNQVTTTNDNKKSIESANKIEPKTNPVDSTKRKMFRCMKCNKNFQNFQVFRNHGNAHVHGEFKCEFCPTVTTNVLKLSVHEYRDHCPEATMERDRDSNETSTSHQWTCPRCQYKSTGLLDYQLHFADAHWKLGNKCNQCGLILKTRNSLRQHVKLSHPTRQTSGEYTKPQLPLICVVCNKIFASRVQLRKHVKRTHSGETVICQHCGKTFSHRENLNQHLKTHSSEKRFVCQICGEKYRYRRSLLLHRKREHGKDQHVKPERPKNCVTCKKIFSSNKHLKYHIRSVHLAKPVVCPHCEKTFGNSENLRAHLKTHSNEKPFLCQICGEKYRQKKSLRLHCDKIHGRETATQKISEKCVIKKNHKDCDERNSSPATGVHQ